MGYEYGNFRPFFFFFWVRCSSPNLRLVGGAEGSAKRARKANRARNNRTEKEEKRKQKKKKKNLKKIWKNAEGTTYGTSAKMPKATQTFPPQIKKGLTKEKPVINVSWPTSTILFFFHLFFRKKYNQFQINTEHKKQNHHLIKVQVTLWFN